MADHRNGLEYIVNTEESHTQQSHIGGEKIEGKDKMKGNGIGSMNKDRHIGKNAHNDEA